MTRTLNLTFTLATLVALLAPPVSGQDGTARSAFSNVISDALIQAEWQTKPIASGVEWRANHFERLLGLPQFISVLDIDLSAAGVSVDVVRADSGRMKTSDLGLREDAVAAVNGSYFESDGTPALFFQDEGTVIRADDDGEIRFWEDGAVVTVAEHSAEIMRRSRSTWQALPDLSDVLVAGPMLVWDGEVQDVEAVAFNLTHHPRTAAGLTSDHHLLLVTADGRSSQSAGLTSHELALVMQGLGCKYALNLDGGGSTTMWIANEGVVNHPSDNGAFDEAGERAVSNAVVVHVE